MFIMPIMMINILIAMMGNTYTTVIAQAEKAWKQQYAQIVMVLERSVRKEKLAACQLEYSIRLNETNDAGMEIRGLMVIKQTKKTRARQRKQAITNWKVGLALTNLVVTTTTNTAMTIERPVGRRIIRGVDMVSSLEMPNMPAVCTPPTRQFSPRIRSDMFRRKDSPGTDSSSNHSNKQWNYDGNGNEENNTVKNVNIEMNETA
ncbi:unnamed protein product [Anisakis simplex]|uniref:Ion_trans domain-containing protein n=1 Tax=Anisakis simplex TaxID=6269 RepID=A0A0M3JZ32_ANISI|nr:unnamed protein product [Anisakis simplex]